MGLVPVLRQRRTAAPETPIFSAIRVASCRSCGFMGYFYETISTLQMKKMSYALGMPYHTDSLSRDERHELALDHIIDRLLSEWQESVVFDGTDWIWSITDSTGCVEDGIASSEHEAKVTMWSRKPGLLRHAADRIVSSASGD